MRSIYDLLALFVLTPFFIILAGTRRRRDSLVLFFILCALMFAVVAIINIARG